jgi:uncharacterized protein
MKKLFIAIALILVSGTSALAQDSYGLKLKRMMEVAGTQASFQVAIKQMLVMFRQQKTNVPENVWNEFEKEFSQTSLDDLVTMLVPVYEKHMTESDLDKVIEFYQTPVGKKFAEKTPLIMQESMQVGQSWGMKIGEKFAARMKEAGY